MKRQWIMFAMALPILKATAAPTSTITTLQPHEGLLAAMIRNGCHEGWLSETMRINDINEDELDTLDDGLLIVLPQGCKSAPPKSVAGASRHAIMFTNALASAAKNGSSDRDPSRQPAASHKEAVPAEIARNGIPINLPHLPQKPPPQKPPQQKTLQQPQPPKKPQQTSPPHAPRKELARDPAVPPWLERMAFLAFATALSTFAWFAAQLRINRRFALLRKKIIVPNHYGKHYTFLLTKSTAKEMYTCPFADDGCGARDLAPNRLREHLAKTHAAATQLTVIRIPKTQAVA